MMIRNPSRATSFAKGTYEEEGKKARIGVPKAQLEIANMKNGGELTKMPFGAGGW